MCSKSHPGLNDTWAEFLGNNISLSKPLIYYLRESPEPLII